MKTFAMLASLLCFSAIAQTYEDAPFIGGVIRDKSLPRSLRLVCIEAKVDKCEVFQFVRTERSQGEEHRHLIHPAFFRFEKNDQLNTGLRDHATEELTSDGPRFFPRSQAGILVPPILILTVPLDILLSPVDATMIAANRFKLKRVRDSINALFSGKKKSVSRNSFELIRDLVGLIKTPLPTRPTCGLFGDLTARIFNCAPTGTYLPGPFQVVTRKDLVVNQEQTRQEIVLDRKTSLLWSATARSVHESLADQACDSGDHLVVLPGLRWRLPTQSEISEARGHGLLRGPNTLYWTGDRFPGTTVPSKYESEEDRPEPERTPYIWGLVKCVAEANKT